MRDTLILHMSGFNRYHILGEGLLPTLHHRVLNMTVIASWKSLSLSYSYHKLIFLLFNIYTALTSTICSGVVLIYFSKFIVQKVYCFIDLKKSWQIKWKIKCLKSCERDLMNMIKYCNCNPIMLRLAWSDAGTTFVCAGEKSDYCSRTYFDFSTHHRLLFMLSTIYNISFFSFSA